MRYYRLVDNGGDARLVVEAEAGVLADLTSIEVDVVDLDDIVRAASLSGLSIDEIARGLLGSGPFDTYELAQIVEDSRAETGDLWLDRPLDPPEVWAAGVTYKTSEMERRRESETPDIYSKVYVADRPELFFKATPERCVGPFESIGVRGDSERSVPEPELAFVVYKGEIVGYTVGNDVSSRSIEGENPLYLPQAKIYDKCCAIGPCLVTPESLGDPHALSIRCSIHRNGKEVFSGETSTSQMARRCEDISDWLHRHNPVPDMTVVLTGTSIVPPPDFTLLEGDVVSIEIDGIGVLENDVVAV
jgi:2-dehydro-3-deoxy-D-arabinonate dehydratase